MTNADNIQTSNDEPPIIEVIGHQLNEFSQQLQSQSWFESEFAIIRMLDEHVIELESALRIMSKTINARAAISAADLQGIGDKIHFTLKALHTPEVVELATRDKAPKNTVKTLVSVLELLQEYIALEPDKLSQLLYPSYFKSWRGGVI